MCPVCPVPTRLAASHLSRLSGLSRVCPVSLSRFVELGNGRRGKPIASCVVASACIGCRPKLFGERGRAFDLLTNVIIERGQHGAAGKPSGFVWHVKRPGMMRSTRALPGRKQDTKRTAFVRAPGYLIDELRLVGKAGGRVWHVRCDAEMQPQEVKK